MIDTYDTELNCFNLIEEGQVVIFFKINKTIQKTISTVFFYKLTKTYAGFVIIMLNADQSTACSDEFFLVQADPEDLMIY